MKILNEKQAELLKLKDIVPFFNILKANISRSYMVMTVIFLKASTLSVTSDYRIVDEVENDISQFLLSKVRNTDLLFKLDDELQWGIILTQSGEREALAFIDRIRKIIEQEKSPFYTDKQYTLQSLVVEIKNDNATFDQLLNNKYEFFNQVNNSPWENKIITLYKTQPLETIKVSILENNELFRDVLKMTIQNMNMNQLDIQIKLFSDGYEFLQSDWYYSSHTHIVFMNDIMPRKNGLEVLHTLRRMANQKKFIIYMMTKRNSQIDMINAYESGIDEYLIKPFDLRLLKAQLKRTFERLWS